MFNIELQALPFETGTKAAPELEAKKKNASGFVRLRQKLSLNEKQICLSYNYLIVQGRQD